MYENVLYEVADGIATITLNRPDKLNAYTTEMGDEVYDAFQSARTDPAVRVVILTGAGRGFCAGVDLEHLARTVQLAIEYAPKPPFASGTPEEARPETVELVKTLFASQSN